MEQKIFNSMELDAIGEMMNISLGSSATAVSNMLNHRVDITTPTVSVVSIEDFTLGDLEPAIAVEIKYVSGLDGSNIMLLKRGDVRTIVDILMGTETPDEEFKLDELTVSAVCEVMNQMMGAASTALSDFLGILVNISTPESYTLDDLDEFKRNHFHSECGMLVVVRFKLGIEDILESEFVNVMSIELTRELLKGFGLTGNGGEKQQAQAAAPAPQPAAAQDSAATMDQGLIDQLMNPQAAAPQAAAPALQPAAAQDSAAAMDQGMIDQLMNPQAAQPAPQQAPVQPMQAPQQQPMQQMPVQQPMQQMPMQQPTYYPQQQPVYYQQPNLIQTNPVTLPTFDLGDRLGEEQAQNLEMIMSVPLQVSVEIGRTTQKVDEILSYSKGTLVVLDKLAGDQVDIFVNGLCVAHGDVVVIDDNFGVRITEVVHQPELFKLQNKQK
ncbi:MAG TPA: flagellar motor switch protein FliN [Candidatus Caccousia stercoris]|uniref:Flagellar motor switch protein FliN n=2 Tax=Eubacteriales TaxID=186802 RepID=A0A9D1FRA6_9FIRM|nr:flagellar motor switch protein FliN [Anaeromassilibacillus sp. An200]HIS78138.1 flagellar motor switch protein FliN [Candidatus Caccousia stercoris]